MTAVELTFQHHGAPSGTILGDEIERDLAPHMGSELCTAVETGYSLAYLYHTLGTNYYADRAELVIYNAMPVMMTGDMWSHQYLDQPNGPWAVMNNQDYAHPDGPFLFTTAHRGAATTFGLEPQYPCCTVNHPQGYPKFVTHSWGLVDDTGLAHVLLSPSRVKTSLATIECDTAYPFDHTLRYTITSPRGLDLYLRVPSWHVPEMSTLTLGDSSTPGLLHPDPATGMHRVRIPSGSTTLTYALGARIRTEPRANNTVAIYYGSLLYTLDVGQANTSSNPHLYNDARGAGFTDIPFPQARDYYIYNTTAWNIAIDPSTLEYHDGGRELPTPIFEYGAPPSYMTVRGCEIEWALYLEATPGAVPESRTCVGESKRYRLIPYGSAKVHMSELPVVGL